MKKWLQSSLLLGLGFAIPCSHNAQCEGDPYGRTICDIDELSCVAPAVVVDHPVIVVNPDPVVVGRPWLGGAWGRPGVGWGRVGRWR